MPADLIVPLPPSPSAPLYVHSRGIARRREGTTIIYEDRKSRSIDLSDRSRALTHVRSRARQTRPNIGLVVEETLWREIWCNYHGYHRDASGIIPGKHNITRADISARMCAARVHTSDVCTYVPATRPRCYSSSNASLSLAIYHSLLTPTENPRVVKVRKRHARGLSRLSSIRSYDIRIL